MTCVRCQTPISADSRFCSKCGAPASSTDDSATRTVLLEDKGEPEPGALLAGKFRVLQMLGRGGMGVVFQAEDTKLHRTVALKFLPRHLVHAEQVRERFLLEARAAAALSHPNICTIHEIYDQEDRPFIEMEFVDGWTLRSRVKEGPLPPDEAAEIARQIAEALAEAHRKGIVHRDIKSNNIMITGPESGHPGQVKVMDFGLAKVRGESLHTREGATLGTAAYMSPEQAQGKTVDHRSDLWSLGVVLYEMLSGALPFPGEPDSAVLYAVVHEEPAALPQIRP
ncbi:MAG: serine/threonine protein kinase [Bryobacter sp.]|nr:serine/threonine protein kinase [Bryobacter sp.]